MSAIKNAREWAFLGMYEDAEKSYGEALTLARGKLAGELKSGVREALEAFVREAEREVSLNGALLQMVKTARLPASSKPPRDVEERPLRKGPPFQETPFSFHQRRTMEADPQVEVLVPRHKSGSQKIPPARSLDDNFFGAPQNAGGYQANPSGPEPYAPRFAPQVYKDPGVWDQPPPRQQRNQPGTRRPAAKAQNTRTAPSLPPQPSGPEKQKERNYDKPWLVPKPPAPAETKEEPPKSRYLLKCYPDGNGPDADLIMMIENSVISQNPNISFDDIAGLEEAKDSLRMNVICPLTMTEYFKKIRTPPKGMLLYGPPGTGKTMLAKAIATTGKTTFCYVHPTVLASKWRGDSEKLVRILFEMARFYAPTTIFIDEIDSLLSSRSSNEHESSRKVKVQFFIEIDGVCSGNANEDGSIPKVFILGATNRPWDLDEAILRRLTKRIYIPLPNEEARHQLFRLKMKGINLSDDIDYNHLVKATENYNSDDIESVCKDAATAPFQKMFSTLTGKETEEEMKKIEKDLLEEPITMQDFNNALKKIAPSSSTQFLSEYEKWTKEHGAS